MNHKLFLIALGFFFSINSSAQNDFKVGLHAGLNYPDIRGHEYARYNSFKIGYLVGASFDQYLNEDLSLKTNVNYERKIREIGITYYDQDAKEAGSKVFTHIYEYINLPVMIKYKFKSSPFFANGGPFMNYLLNDKIKPYPPNDQSGLTEQKKIDLGLSFGIGAGISLDEKNELTIEVRDDLGLIDTGGVPEQLTGTVKTNVIKLILGWNLGI